MLRGVRHALSVRVLFFIDFRALYNQPRTKKLATLRPKYLSFKADETNLPYSFHFPTFCFPYVALILWWWRVLGERRALRQQLLSRAYHLEDRMYNCDVRVQQASLKYGAWNRAQQIQLLPAKFHCTATCLHLFLYFVGALMTAFHAHNCTRTGCWMAFVF